MTNTALTPEEAGRIAAAVVGPAGSASPDVLRIRAARATRIMATLLGYADSLFVGEGDQAHDVDTVRLVSERFRALVEAEPHRVAKLLSSVETGRVMDTLNALLTYRTPAEVDADYAKEIERDETRAADDWDEPAQGWHEGDEDFFRAY